MDRDLHETQIFRKPDGNLSVKLWDGYSPAEIHGAFIDLKSVTRPFPYRWGGIQELPEPFLIRCRHPLRQVRGGFEAADPSQILQQLFFISSQRVVF